MTEAQIKLLADLRSGAVLANVKPLEWQDEERGANQPVAVPRYSHARTQIRYYNIHDARGARPNSPQFRWTLTADGRSLGPSDGVFSGFPSMAEAKAAAQADYEARILSTMSPSPDLSASLAEMIEGLVLELRGANETVAAIERAIPDWRSYRDLVDAVECKLAEVRS